MRSHCKSNYWRPSRSISFSIRGAFRFRSVCSITAA
jgi:hypothetical protein